MTPAAHTMIATCASTLERRLPYDILAALAAHFAPRIAFATGFGPEGCVLIDVIARHELPIEVFTLDTGVLFPETYALWHRLEARYRITIRAVRSPFPPDESKRIDDRLWERDPDACCQARKVLPLRTELAKLDAWVTAIRRDQTPERANAKVIEWDAKFELVKVNPLAAWTSEQIWNYLREYEVPTNPLHERGYPSIGCEPCTSPVTVGEDPRAGRWRGRDKKECGLHTRYAWAREPGTPAPGTPKGS